MGFHTVRRFTRARTSEELFTGRQWQNGPTKLDAFKPYLHQQWVDGRTNTWNSGKRSPNAATAAVTPPCATAYAPRGPHRAPRTSAHSRYEPSQADS